MPEKNASCAWFFCNKFTTDREIALLKMAVYTDNDGNKLTPDLVVTAFKSLIDEFESNIIGVPKVEYNNDEPHFMIPVKFGKNPVRVSLAQLQLLI